MVFALPKQLRWLYYWVTSAPCDPTSCCSSRSLRFGICVMESWGRWLYLSSNSTSSVMKTGKPCPESLGMLRAQARIIEEQETLSHTSVTSILRLASKKSALLCFSQRSSSTQPHDLLPRSEALSPTLQHVREEELESFSALFTYIPVLTSECSTSLLTLIPLFKSWFVRDLLSSSLIYY